MMVARQFIAWIVWRKDPSRRDGMRDGRPGLTTLRRSLEKPESLMHKRRTPRYQGNAHTVPTGRCPSWGLFQAINCLATIIQSLRDKSESAICSTTGIRLYKYIQGTPLIDG
jgi:hypothetical protein